MVHNMKSILLSENPTPVYLDYFFRAAKENNQGVKIIDRKKYILSWTHKMSSDNENK